MLVGLLLAGLMTGAGFAQGRVATIDLNKAFTNYWKKKEAEANLKEQQADMDKELKKILDDGKRAYDTYQKNLSDSNDQAVSTEERDKRRKLAEDKYKEANDLKESADQYRRQAVTRLQEQSKRVRETIVGEIKNVVVAKARAAGYTLVLDIAAESANMTPIVLYSNGEADITDAVLDQLNAAAPSGTAPGRDDKSPKKDKK